jgi:Fe-Mn family superoxide dismutase
MSPNGGGLPTGELLAAIESSFGSFDEFKAKFSKAGATQFDQDGFGYEKEVN